MKESPQYESFQSPNRNRNLRTENNNKPSFFRPHS